MYNIYTYTYIVTHIYIQSNYKFQGLRRTVTTREMAKVCYRKPHLKCALKEAGGTEVRMSREGEYSLVGQLPPCTIASSQPRDRRAWWKDYETRNQSRSGFCSPLSPLL